MYGQSRGYKPGKWDTFDLNTNFTVFFVCVVGSFRKIYPIWFIHDYVVQFMPQCLTVFIDLSNKYL